MFRKLYKQLNKKIRLLQNKGKEPYLSLYRILGFYPNDLQIYEQALLHKSSSIENGDGRWINNERLEFLGDGILDAVVADIVYRMFPNKREGFLTNVRSNIVKRETMNRVALELELDKKVVYSAKICSHTNHMYGNALEALIGAIYLDQGYDACYKFIKEIMIEKHIDINKLVKKDINFKSNMIEWSQKNKIPVSFDLIESFKDNDGNNIFQTAINLMGENIGIGIGYSKKESQQAASKMALKRIHFDKELQQKIEEEKKRIANEQVLPEEQETEGNNDPNDYCEDGDIIERFTVQ